MNLPRVNSTHYFRAVHSSVAYLLASRRAASDSSLSSGSPEIKSTSRCLGSSSARLSALLLRRQPCLALAERGHARWELLQGAQLALLRSVGENRDPGIPIYIEKDGTVLQERSASPGLGTAHYLTPARR